MTKEMAESLIATQFGRYDVLRYTINKNKDYIFSVEYRPTGFVYEYWCAHIILMIMRESEIHRDAGATAIIEKYPEEFI